MSMKRKPQPEPVHSGPITSSGKYQVCAACMRSWKTEGKTPIPKCAPFPRGTRYYG
jgi:hypothetical protein